MSIEHHLKQVIKFFFGERGVHGHPFPNTISAYAYEYIYTTREGATSIFTWQTPH